MSHHWMANGGKFYSPVVHVRCEHRLHESEPFTSYKKYQKNKVLLCHVNVSQKCFIPSEWEFWTLKRLFCVIVVQISAFFQTVSVSFWLKLELHTWAQLSPRSSALTFDLELFGDISANISGLDCKQRSDICFSSPHRTDQRSRKSPGAIRGFRHFCLSVCLSVSVVSPSRFTQIVRPELLWPSLGCSNNIIQLSFYPQAMNNLWIVNQRRGVSSLDWMGPQGLRWRETKPAPFHPLLAQIKIKVVLKGPACAQVIWGPVEKNPRENTTLIPIHVLTDRQIKNVFPSQAHPVSLNLATGCTRCDETQQSSSVKDGPVESVCV